MDLLCLRSFIKAFQVESCLCYFNLLQRINLKSLVKRINPIHCNTLEISSEKSFYIHRKSINTYISVPYNFNSAWLFAWCVRCEELYGLLCPFTCHYGSYSCSKHNPQSSKHTQWLSRENDIFFLTFEIFSIL